MHFFLELFFFFVYSLIRRFFRKNSSFTPKRTVLFQEKNCSFSWFWTWNCSFLGKELFLYYILPNFGKELFLILWNCSLQDNIFWNCSLQENIFWNCSLQENILWNCSFQENILWNCSFLENILWNCSLLDFLWNISA